MTIEKNNTTENISWIITSLFKIDAIPENMPELITKSSWLTKETVLQLMLYWNSEQWKWYENQDKFCGDRNIDPIIEAIYVYIRKPTYILDDDEFTVDQWNLYENIRNRLSLENPANTQQEKSHQQVMKILQ